MTIEEKRKTLIFYAIREHRLRPAYSESYTYANIIQWQQMSDKRIEVWYDKFFQSEPKI